MTAERESPAHTLLEITPRQPPVEVIAIGASAGGVEALTAVAAQLPADLPAAVLVVLHVSESSTSVLPAILDRAGPLPASVAHDGEDVLPGHVYVSPPAQHLTVDGARLRLRQGPRENGQRPAVDPLFRAVAASYGSHAAGVVLSGARDDGSAGLRELKLAGAATIVQDPQDALYAGMPRNAMKHVDVDAVLPVQQIGFALARLAGQNNVMRPAMESLTSPAFPINLETTGLSSRFACPDCGGALFEFRAGSVDRFACVIGHAYSFESLFDEQAQGLELALWTAVRSLEDRAVLLQRMERRSRDAGSPRAARAFGARARDTTDRAQTIRTAMERVSTAWRMKDGNGDTQLEPRG